MTRPVHVDVSQRKAKVIGSLVAGREEDIAEASAGIDETPPHDRRSTSGQQSSDTARRADGPGAPSGGAPADQHLVHLQGLVLFISLLSFFSQLLQSWMSFLATTFERAFSIGATEVGMIGGAYSLGAMITAVPGGVLVERFGARPVIIVGGLLMAAGILWFAAGSTPTDLVVARFLTGVGAGPLVPAGLAVLSAGVSGQTFRALNGEKNFFGRLGTIAATGPLAAIFVAFGWREAMFAVAVAVAVMAVAALIILPAAASARSAPSYGGSLGKLLSRREVLGPIAAQAALTGAAFTVIGIWGAPWIASDFQGSTTTQAFGLTAMAIAYAAGALASGIVFRLVGPATIPLALALGGALLSMAAFGLVGETWFVPFLVALGLALSPSPLLTAELREAAPTELSVLAMSLSPMALGFGIFGCQTLSGIIIDAFPHVAGEHPPEAFHSMFGALALLLVLAAVILVIARGSLTGSHREEAGPRNKEMR